MYAPKDRKELIVPVRLDLESTFNFACDREMACFTKCCRDAHIILTPLDVIRMKRRLDLSSDEFLMIYTTLGHIEKSELPVPVLKTLEDDEKKCPFLGGEGCKIYEDRPVACRYYPIGSGMFHNKDAESNERFFALIKEPHCLGHGMGQDWTVAEWRENQGIDQYDDANSGWVELVLKRKSLGPFINIPDKTLQMFFMACYNIDAFRRFVFESKFLDVFVVSPERREQMASDDVELLKFAFEWLKKTLFGEGDLEIRELVADGRSVEI